MKAQHITLTTTTKDDLPALFQFQKDPEANHLAAFTPKDAIDEAMYIQKHSQFLNDHTNNTQTIKVNGVIVGSIAKFILGGEAEITYWIDSAFWGKGIATTALTLFLEIEKTRPLLGRVAFDNYGSQKVLEKCGFIKVGTDKGFANARQKEIEEYIYKLSAK